MARHRVNTKNTLIGSSNLDFSPVLDMHMRAFGFELRVEVLGQTTKLEQFNTLKYADLAVG